jgi:sialic acid synthase SpsE
VHTITGALAVSSGAAILEKHLTLDRRRPGPDHAASLEPAEFAEYVRLAHLAHRMRGPFEKRVLAIEQPVREQTRQSVALAVDVPAGVALRPEYLTVMRPGTGIPAARLQDVIGRQTVRPRRARTLLQWVDLGDMEDAGAPDAPHQR